MERKDVPKKVDWFNDPELLHVLNADYPISEVGTNQWLDRVALDPSRRDLVITVVPEKKVIGYIGLTDIDWRHQKANSYIGIGKTKHRGRGHGWHAQRALHAYAFDALNLNRVYAYVWEENTPMLGLMKKLGYKVEGVLVQDVWAHGGYRNKVLLALLRDEYRRQRA